MRTTKITQRLVWLPLRRVLTEAVDCVPWGNQCSSIQFWFHSALYAREGSSAVSQTAISSALPLRKLKEDGNCWNPHKVVGASDYKASWVPFSGSFLRVPYWEETPRNLLKGSHFWPGHEMKVLIVGTFLPSCRFAPPYLSLVLAPCSAQVNQWKYTLCHLLILSNLSVLTPSCFLSLSPPSFPSPFNLAPLLLSLFALSVSPFLFISRCGKSYLYVWHLHASAEVCVCVWAGVWC